MALTSPSLFRRLHPYQAANRSGHFSNTLERSTAGFHWPATANLQVAANPVSLRARQCKSHPNRKGPFHAARSPWRPRPPTASARAGFPRSEAAIVAGLSSAGESPRHLDTRTPSEGHPRSLASHDQHVARGTAGSQTRKILRRMLQYQTRYKYIPRLEPTRRSPVGSLQARRVSPISTAHQPLPHTMGARRIIEEPIFIQRRISHLGAMPKPCLDKEIFVPARQVGRRPRHRHSRRGTGMARRVSGA